MFYSISGVCVRRCSMSEQQVNPVVVLMVTER